MNIQTYVTILLSSKSSTLCSLIALRINTDCRYSFVFSFALTGRRIVAGVDFVSFAFLCSDESSRLLEAAERHKFGFFGFSGLGYSSGMNTFVEITHTRSIGKAKI
jgi:hypothetical protein